MWTICRYTLFCGVFGVLYAVLHLWLGLPSVFSLAPLLGIVTAMVYDYSTPSKSVWECEKVYTVIHKMKLAAKNSKEENEVSFSFNFAVDRDEAIAYIKERAEERIKNLDTPIGCSSNYNSVSFRDKAGNVRSWDLQVTDLKRLRLS